MPNDNPGAQAPPDSTDSTRTFREHQLADRLQTRCRDELTGRLCDACNRHLETGDECLILADYVEGRWTLLRTHCEACGMDLRGGPRQDPQAVVEAEIGRTLSDMAANIRLPTVRVIDGGRP